MNNMEGKRPGFGRFAGPSGFQNISPRFRQRAPPANQHFYTHPHLPLPRHQVSYSDMNVFSNGPRRPHANFGKNVYQSPPNFNAPPPRQQISYAESDMFAPNSELQHNVNGGVSSHQQFHPLQSPPPRFNSPHQQNGIHMQNNRNQNGQWDNAFQSRNPMNFHGNFTENNAGGATGKHNQGGNQRQPWNNSIWNNLPKGANRHQERIQNKKKKPKPDKRDRAENNVYFCDTCDRGFKVQEKYQEHVDSHVKCQHDGCMYTAHPKLVRLHDRTQHSSGLASKIWKLESPEEIKKWREERKRNFPTAENMKRKKEIIEEKIARGEVIETKTFGKMRNKGGKKDKFGKWKNRRQNNGNNRDTPNRSPVKSGATVTKENTKKKDRKSCDGDPLSMLEGREECPPDSADPVTTFGGLAALMSVYSDSDDANPTQTDKQADAVEDAGNKEQSTSCEPKNKKARKRKRQRRNGHNDDHSSQAKIRKRSTLLEKLLAPDIRRERNLILQCVHHIVKENFFGVGNYKELKSALNDKTESFTNTEKNGTTNVECTEDCRTEPQSEMSVKEAGVQDMEQGDDKNIDKDTKEESTENQVTKFIIDDHAWE